MGKRVRKPKTPVSQTIKSLFAMPPADFYRQPVLHINCRGEIEVEGGAIIQLYNAQQIQLDMGRWLVTLYGDELLVQAANKRELLIRGRVFRAEFTYKDGRAT